MLWNRFIGEAKTKDLFLTENNIKVLEIYKYERNDIFLYHIDN